MGEEKCPQAKISARTEMVTAAQKLAEIQQELHILQMPRTVGVENAEHFRGSDLKHGTMAEPASLSPHFWF